MATIERIQEILNSVVHVTIKDDAGIITPAGIDAKIKVDTLKQCLKIAQEEKNKHAIRKNNG